MVEPEPNCIALNENGADLIRRYFGRRKERIAAGGRIEVAKSADTSATFGIIKSLAELYFALFHLGRSNDLLTLI